MNKKRAGVIECGEIVKLSEVAQLGEVEGFYLRKILKRNKDNSANVSIHNPQTELVEDIKAILLDAEIDLVIIAEPDHDDMDIVGQALQSGKHVRII